MVLFGEGDIKWEELDDGEGTDCCDDEQPPPPPPLLPPVNRSIRADDELRLLCDPPSPLIDVVGDVASRAFRPGMENAMFVVDEAVEALESLPGDGAAIESRRDCCCCWLSRLRVAAAFNRICCGTPELSWSCCLRVEDCPDPD